MNRPSTGRGSLSAFTLTEMLVSVAVLVIIMTFIAQMMDNVSISTTLSSKHIDTDNQARLVFDRMAIDFGGMINRPDVDYVFAKAEGNDKMFFYSEAPGFFDDTNPKLFPSGEANPKSDVSLIGYAINTGVNNTGSNITPPAYCLQRLSKGLTWDESNPTNGPGGFNFLTFNITPANNAMTPLPPTTLSGNLVTGSAVGLQPEYAGNDSSYDVLANQVFRFEYCFQVKNIANGKTIGSVFSNYPVATLDDTSVIPQQKDPTTSDDISNAVGTRWYNSTDHRAFILTGHPASTTGNASTSWSPLGMSDVNAIVVAIAVMDTNSRKTLNQTQLGAAAASLPDFNNGQEPNTPSGNLTLMAAAWSQQLNLPQGGFAAETQVPKFAASQIRIYQRFFYLNNH